jgi:hypothetical protein
MQASSTNISHDNNSKSKNSQQSSVNISHMEMGSVHSSAADDVMIPADGSAGPLQAWTDANVPITSRSGRVGSVVDDPRRSTGRVVPTAHTTDAPKVHEVAA